MKTIAHPPGSTIVHKDGKGQRPTVHLITAVAAAGSHAIVTNVDQTSNGRFPTNKLETLKFPQPHFLVGNFKIDPVIWVTANSSHRFKNMYTSVLLHPELRSGTKSQKSWASFKQVVPWFRTALFLATGTRPAQQLWEHL